MNGSSVEPERPPGGSGARAPRHRSFYRIASTFYLVLAVAGLLWIGVARGRIDLALFVVPATFWIDLGSGLAVAALLLAFWWALRSVSALARELEQLLARLVAPLTRSEAVALALVSGLAEELFFRGALQHTIGLFPAALVFALLHSGPGKAFRVWGLFALAAGLAFGILVAWRGALGGAIVAHVLVNGVNLLRLAKGSSAPAGGPAAGDVKN
ncbi:MAG: lysostaphin resistance A-like protein [Thermoanaerobaculia bacterium]